MTRVTRQEKAVAARLRQELAASRPAFSEALHGRLCEVVRQQRAGAAPWRGHPVLRWASFAAAACLLIAACFVWQAIRAAPDGGAPCVAGLQRTSMGSMTQLADEVVAKTGATVDSAVKAQRWAYLDQDVRSVLEMPAARLPFDVVSSLLSVQRRKDSHISPSRPTSQLDRNRLRGQAGVRDG